MSRSIWKGPFLDVSIRRKSNITKLKIWSRASVIPAFLIGENILIHNGKEFKKVLITREKVGYKFGEFSFTRKYVSRIKAAALSKKKVVKK